MSKRKTIESNRARILVALFCLSFVVSLVGCNTARLLTAGGTYERRPDEHSFRARRTENGDLYVEFKKNVTVFWFGSRAFGDICSSQREVWKLSIPQTEASSRWWLRNVKTNECQSPITDFDGYLPVYRAQETWGLPKRECLCVTEKVTPKGHSRQVYWYVPRDSSQAYMVPLRIEGGAFTPWYAYPVRLLLTPPQVIVDALELILEGTRDLFYQVA